MSDVKKLQFGDLNYNYNQVKVGDKDAQSELILNVYYTTEKMVIYRTKGNLVITYSAYANRFSILNAKKQEINNLLQYKINQEQKNNSEKTLEDLRVFYAPQLAHAYQMCYLEEYEEAILIAENIKKSIENSIISKAQYTYFSYYLKYILYVFGVTALFLLWNSLKIAEKNAIPNWFVWHIYIAVAGIIGSFISAKEKVANRTIDFNIPTKRTILDVKLRVLLGGLFGILTVWLVYSKVLMGFLEGQINTNLFGSGNVAFSQKITVLLIGIIGGFSERLVPDTLQAKLNDIPNKKDTNEEVKKIAKAVNEAKKKN